MLNEYPNACLILANARGPYKAEIEKQISTLPRDTYRIIEFENDHLEKLQKMIAQTYGFHMLSHRMEIYGLCSECTMVQVQKESLACAKPGAKLVISGIDGGRNVNMRLRSMGLKPGDNVEVVNSFGGQIVIAVDYTRLVIGKGLANKIKVQNVTAL